MHNIIANQSPIAKLVGQRTSNAQVPVWGVNFFLLLITRNSAIADKPARRVYRSVKVTKHSTIPYDRYSFLLCNCNFVFKRRRFTIFDFKNGVSLK